MKSLHFIKKVKYLELNKV